MKPKVPISFNNFVLILLSGLIILIGIKLKKTTDSHKKLLMRNEHIFESSLLNVIESSRFCSILVPIDSTTNCFDENLSLRDIITQNDISVGLWYPKNLCDECYSNELEEFKRFSHDIGIKNTFLLSNSSNLRLLRSFKINNKIRSPIFTFMNGFFELEGISQPLVFTIRRSERIETPLLIRNSSEKDLEIYFSLITQII